MSLRRMIFVLIALFVSGATVMIGRAWLAPRESRRRPGRRPDRDAGPGRAGQPARRPVRPAREFALAGLARGRRRRRAISSTARARSRISSAPSCARRSAMASPSPRAGRAARRPRLPGRGADAGLSRRHRAGDGELGHRRLRLSRRPRRSDPDHDRPATTTASISATPARRFSPTCACSRSTSAPTTRTRRSWSTRPRRSR